MSDDENRPSTPVAIAEVAELSLPGVVVDDAPPLTITDTKHYVPEEDDDGERTATAETFLLVPDVDVSDSSEVDDEIIEASE